MYECTTKKSDKVGRIIVLQYGSSALSSALALLWNFYAFRGKRKTFQINQSICARACVWCALRLNMWLQSLFSVASHPSLTLHRDSGPSKTSSWSKTSLEFTDFILYNNKILQSYATVSFSTVIIRASRLRCVSVCVCVCVCVCVPLWCVDWWAGKHAQRLKYRWSLLLRVRIGQDLSLFIWLSGIKWNPQLSLTIAQCVSTRSDRAVMALQSQ